MACLLLSWATSQQLSRAKVERGHARGAAASLTSTFYGPLNVHPSTCAVPAPPGISVGWFSRTQSSKIPCTFDLGVGRLEIFRAGQCEFFIKFVKFFACWKLDSFIPLGF